MLSAFNVKLALSLVVFAAVVWGVFKIAKNNMHK